MEQAEILINRLVSVGYEYEQAIELIQMYDQNNKLSELENYIITKESLRGEF